MQCNYCNKQAFGRGKTEISYDYPMHVILDVSYAGSGLVPTRIWPGVQTGVHLDNNGGQLRMDATFEGILKTRIEFRQP